MSILLEIVARKRADLTAWIERTPMAVLRSVAGRKPPPPSLGEALRSAPMGLIAEVKHRSPSAGVIREPFDPPVIARAYAGAGAQAVSVLMDEPYFSGGAAHFHAVRESIDLPMLYKEFVVDAWQVWHARSLGASAVLLIAAVLDDAELASLVSVAAEAGLETLVEVHDEPEMDRAAAVGARLIGVNNRDLRTFQVSLENSFRLIDRAPAGCTFVSESGIRTAEDVLQLQEAGAHAVLVGETLLRQPDPGVAATELMGPVWAAGHGAHP